MPKILFVATVPEHFRYFHLPCFQMLREMGWQVHTACGAEETFPHTDRQFVIPIGRSPLDRRNAAGLRMLRQILRDGQYDAVHAHTPMGGTLARLAARPMRGRGTRVLYTAHGFHFYKGAPLLSWLLFYPAEWLLSFCTDTLITINDEDYAFAKRRLHARKTELVHGVGCDTARFYRAGADERADVRCEFGFAPDDTVIVYVAELNANKHQDLLIRAAAALHGEFPALRLLLVGPDHIDGAYARLAQELHAPVCFAGERQDVPRILAACDLYAASSLREGLPVNVIEAMAAGLPAVAVDNRGHRALVQDGRTGYLVQNEAQMTDRLRLLLRDGKTACAMGDAARQAAAAFDLRRVLEELREIYTLQRRE